MAEVTAFTAARAKAIEDNTVVSGEVVNDDLILTRFDETTVNAGNVRGPVGSTGYPNPTGTFIIGGWAADPVGYLILNGALVVGGAITYPDLAAAFPGWVVGSDIQLPDAAETVPMVGSGAAGVVSGSMSHTLTPPNLAAHDHAVANHDHTTPAHRHTTASHGHTIAKHNHTTPHHRHYIPNHRHSMHHGHADVPHRHTQNVFDNIRRDATPTSSGYKVAFNNSLTSGFIQMYLPSSAPTTSKNGISITNHVGHTGDVPTATLTTNTNDATHDRGLTPSTAPGALTTNVSGGDTGGSGTLTTNIRGTGSPIDHTPKHITVQMAVKT